MDVASFALHSSVCVGAFMQKALNVALFSRDVHSLRRWCEANSHSRNVIEILGSWNCCMCVMHVSWMLVVSKRKIPAGISERYYLESKQTHRERREERDGERGKERGRRRRKRKGCYVREEDQLKRE